jgi:hypothetical protein
MTHSHHDDFVQAELRRLLEAALGSSRTDEERAEAGRRIGELGFCRLLRDVGAGKGAHEAWGPFARPLAHAADLRALALDDLSPTVAPARVSPPQGFWSRVELSMAAVPGTLPAVSDSDIRGTCWTSLDPCSPAIHDPREECSRAVFDEVAIHGASLGVPRRLACWVHRAIGPTCDAGRWLADTVALIDGRLEGQRIADWPMPTLHALALELKVLVGVQARQAEMLRVDAIAAAELCAAVRLIREASCADLLHAWWDNNCEPAGVARLLGAQDRHSWVHDAICATIDRLDPEEIETLHPLEREGLGFAEAVRRRQGHLGPILPV